MKPLSIALSLGSICLVSRALISEGYIQAGLSIVITAICLCAWLFGRREA